MLGRTLRVQSALSAEPTLILGTLADLHQSAPQLRLEADLPPDAYWLTTASLNGASYTVITAANDRGVRRLALLENLSASDYSAASLSRIMAYSDLPLYCKFC